MKDKLYTSIERIRMKRLAKELFKACEKKKRDMDDDYEINGILLTLKNYIRGSH